MDRIRHRPTATELETGDAHLPEMIRYIKGLISIPDRAAAVRNAALAYMAHSLSLAVATRNPRRRRLSCCLFRLFKGDRWTSERQRLWRLDGRGGPSHWLRGVWTSGGQRSGDRRGYGWTLYGRTGDTRLDAESMDAGPCRVAARRSHSLQRRPLAAVALPSGTLTTSRLQGWAEEFTKFLSAYKSFVYITVVSTQPCSHHDSPPLHQSAISHCLSRLADTPGGFAQPRAAQARPKNECAIGIRLSSPSWQVVDDELTMC
jgi:hypothetical protein